MALGHADRAVVLDTGMTVLAGTAGDLCARDDIKAFYLGLATPARAPEPQAAGYDPE